MKNSLLIIMLLAAAASAKPLWKSPDDSERHGSPGIVLEAGERVVVLVNQSFVATGPETIIDDTMRADKTMAAHVVLQGFAAPGADGEVDQEADFTVPKSGRLVVLLNPTSYTGTPVLLYTVPAGRTFTGKVRIQETLN